MTDHTEESPELRQAKALEQIALALGTCVAFVLPTLESIDAKLPAVRRQKRKRRTKRRLPGLLK